MEITNAAENIMPTFVNDDHPQTAVAKLKSGPILVVRVDGRQPAESIGMSLTKLADLLLDFGAAKAINGWWRLQDDGYQEQIGKRAL